MIWDEFLRHFRFCDEEDSGLSDEEQERKGPKNRPKHTRKQIHQAKKNFLEKFKTASYCRCDNTGAKNNLFMIEPPMNEESFRTWLHQSHYRKTLKIKENKPYLHLCQNKTFYTTLNERTMKA
ncbi:hypothetical protein H9625_01375 [Phocaeicola sp. Sa1CVN1]|uniref:Uncharacterized protein n=3 Tax=Bacteroidaceae TaxID=815 RepID=A0ABR8Y4Q2_9BACT|nr:hypothetical protein [Phocaeicola intestinalis]MBD8039113.1 hypothetical protein [Phocaeicola intestinalis]